MTAATASFLGFLIVERCGGESAAGFLRPGSGALGYVFGIELGTSVCDVGEAGHFDVFGIFGSMFEILLASF